MEYTVGTVVEGKVTGITKFGAFISLPGNKTGMVHISEIAYAYVNDINEFLTVGQEVKAVIIAVDDAGKINLSIKKAQEPPARQNRGDRNGQDRNRGDRGGYQNRGQNDRGDRSGQDRNRGQNAQGDRNGQGGGERPFRNNNRGGYQNRGGNAQRGNAAKEPQTFDDMLKQFMADSDSNLSSNKMYADHRTKRRRQ